MKKNTLYIIIAFAGMAAGIKAQQTKLYGMTFGGGTHGQGAILNYNVSTSTETVNWSLGAEKNGTDPYGSLVLDPVNNHYYGMTYLGGNNGLGAIIDFDPGSNTEQAVWSFGTSTDGQKPLGNLVYNATNKVFYGLTGHGGANAKGAIISFNPVTGAEKVVWSFGSGTDGSIPFGNLVYDPNTSLYYGMTTAGGTVSSNGAIISFNPKTNAEAVVYSFGNTGDGFYPTGSLVYDTASKLFYGTTYYGGANASGTIISFNTSTKAEAVVWSFGAGLDGASPNGNLVYNPNDKLYYVMTTAGGTKANGAIISFNVSTKAELVRWNFGVSGTDGKLPYGDLIFDPNTLLMYGLTDQGGANGLGTIFSFSPAKDSAKVRVNLTAATDGKNPQGNLVYDANTSLYYAMIYAGGSNNTGTIISFSSTTFTDNVIIVLGGNADGTSPNANLVFDTANSMFYGMTPSGGANNTGTIISFNPVTNKDSVLWTFGYTGDGATPNGSLVYYPGTKLYYGTTTAGGSKNLGTLFSFNPANGAENVLWSFGVNAGDGQVPEADLVYDTNTHLFYGLTYGGGSKSVGTIFSFNPVGNAVATVYSLAGGTTDGELSYGNLVYDPGTKLFYAMTQNGGTKNLGAIISFNTKTSAEALVWSFGNSTDGQSPDGSLVYDTTAKVFYGMTAAGGTSSKGAIFSFNTSSKTETVLYSLGSGSDGASPYGNLIYDVTNKLYYGMTSAGGSSGNGAIISFNTTTKKDAVLWNFLNNSADGTAPNGSLTLLTPNCTFKATASVVQNVLCNNSSNGNVQVTLTGGASPITYSWSNGTSTISTANPTGAILPAGTYSVTVTDGLGCVVTSSTVALTNPAPIKDSQAVTLCQGQEIKVGKHIYKTTGLFKDTVITKNGCDSMIVTNLIVNPLPVVTVSGKDSIMPGTKDTLTATGATTYVWTNGSTADTAIVSPASNTTYTVTGTNSANGCSDTASIMVIVKQVTGLANISSDNGVLLYPNPGNATIYISFTATGNTTATINIIDITGRKVMQMNTDISNSKIVPLQIGDLANGTYFAEVITQAGRQTVKFVKQ